MKRIYTTAMGKQIDMDSLRIANEKTIAVGNMKVNARGDEIARGGNVQSTRNQALEEHYRLEAAEKRGRSRQDIMAKQKSAGVSTRSRTNKKPNKETVYMEGQENENTVAPQPENTPAVSNDTPETTATPALPDRRLRGNLADSIAKEATVNQELIPDPRRPKGPTRI